MPSVAVAPSAYYDTCERTSRWISRTERSKKVDRNWQDISTSQVLTQNAVINSLQGELAKLSLLSNDWNGYGSPRPSAAAISSASSIVSRFRSLSVIPERVSASADGGVAVIFVGVDKRRAVIESFGTEEDYVLLYDTEGNSRILGWSVQDRDQNEALAELESHLRGL